MFLKKVCKICPYISLGLIISLMVFCVTTLASEKSGWTRVNNRSYYTHANGVTAKGMTQINGLTYYMGADGALQTGWIWHENNWYFAMPSGELTSGWLTLDGKWYYMRPNGVMVTNGWRTIDGIQYYVNEKGALATNQFVGKKYVNGDGIVDSKYDIRRLESEKGKMIKNPSNRQYEEMAEQLNALPQKILKYYIDNEWKFICVADVPDFGTVELWDQSYTESVKFDSGKKEIRAAGVEDFFFNFLQQWEAQNQISGKNSLQLLNTMDLSMNEEIDIKANGTELKRQMRQYWLLNTMRYLEAGNRDEMKFDNIQLYTLIEKLVNEYHLQ